MKHETPTVREVKVAEIINLRHRILRAGLPRSTAVFSGDDDAAAIHLAAFDGDDLIGCVTLHRKEDGSYQLRGMAVDTQRQRGGVGRMLLIESERRAVAGGARTIWANCRTPAVPFYEKFGWKIVSDEFVIETAEPHFKMAKSL
jgi:N-acetylglutamate synthase-like GNAT family acetyltransferase